MKKHVLLIVQNNSFPSDKRVFKEALSLKEAGYDVSVISPVSDWDPEWQVEFRGMRVFRYRNFESQGGIAAFFVEYGNALIRIFLLSLKLFFKERFQVIHVANPPDFFWPMALFYKLFGVKFIYDQHDIAPEMLKANQGREGLLYKLLLINERMTVVCASAIITVNESLRQRLLDRYRMRRPIAVVYNCPNADFESIKDAELSRQFEGKKIVLFIGLMAPLDGVDTLVEVAEKMIIEKQRSDFVFLLVGDGPEKPRLERRVQKLGLQHQIVFTGRVAYDQVKKYLHIADVCVAPDEKNEFSDHFTLVKVLEYMKAGKPFVGFRLNETSLIAGEAACYAENVDEFGQHIIRLLDDPELAERHGRMGRQIIEEKYLWEHQETNLIGLYEKILNRGDRNYGG